MATKTTAAQVLTHAASTDAILFEAEKRTLGMSTLLTPSDMFNPTENAANMFRWLFKRAFNDGTDTILLTVPPNLFEKMCNYLEVETIPWSVDSQGRLISTPKAHKKSPPRECWYSKTLLQTRAEYVESLPKDGAEITLMSLNIAIYNAMYYDTLPQWSVYSNVAKLVVNNWETIAPIVEAAGWRVHVDEFFMTLITN